MTLSLVGVSEWTKPVVSAPASCAADDARHLVERRDEAVDMAADFDAFAERKDVRVGGPHELVDHDAAIDSQTRPLGQSRVGADAHGHDDERGRDDRAVGELAAPSTRSVPRIAFVLALVITLMPRSSIGALEQIAGGGVELALHQRRHQMHDA